MIATFGYSSHMNIETCGFWLVNIVNTGLWLAEAHFPDRDWMAWWIVVTREYSAIYKIVRTRIVTFHVSTCVPGLPGNICASQGNNIAQTQTQPGTHGHRGEDAKLAFILLTVNGIFLSIILYLLGVSSKMFCSKHKSSSQAAFIQQKVNIKPSYNAISGPLGAVSYK